MKIKLTFLFLILLYSCESKVEGNFFIENSSEDRPIVPLRLIVNQDTIFEQDANYSSIQPDLQNVEQIKLPKGEHEIIFEVPGSSLRRIERVNFNKDKWIFLSYYYKKPADSLKRLQLDKQFGGLKNADSIFSNFYNGRKPSLNFHLMENEPIHH